MVRQECLTYLLDSPIPIRGVSGVSGVFSIEDSVIALEEHKPTKQFDEA